MPIQVPAWYDFLTCSTCLEEYNANKYPITLGCGHSICSVCFCRIGPKICPFDQTTVTIDQKNVVLNTALLQLCGVPPPEKPVHPPKILALGLAERNLYDTAVKCLEDLGMHLKFNPCGKISKPIQKRLAGLIQCPLTEKEGRNRILKSIRNLAERAVLEIAMHNQNPLQLGSNLWAAVRSRGCQFLGPSTQEEVIKLVLLALEDGSALSRKVLVMFVVQRLEAVFPQVSKTCIGHVVQLLYRASCFRVSKRDSDSSLMELKSEYRTYENLRREHDAQIVQIAAEAGLKIAPDQWSSLLYGDPSHKSHMQSIIDKLQTPQSFNQSVQELLILFQRSGDSSKADSLGPCLQLLTTINPAFDTLSPSWKDIADALCSIRVIVQELVRCTASQKYLNRMEVNQNTPAPVTQILFDPNKNPNYDLIPSLMKKLPRNYKIVMCNHVSQGRMCSRGTSCFFAHSEEELELYRTIHRKRIKDRYLSHLRHSVHSNSGSQEFQNNNRHPYYHPITMGNGNTLSPNVPHCSSDAFPSTRYNSPSRTHVDVRELPPIITYCTKSTNHSRDAVRSDSILEDDQNSVPFENQTTNPFGPISRENNVSNSSSNDEPSNESGNLSSEQNKNYAKSPALLKTVLGRESSPVVEWQSTHTITQQISSMRLESDTANKPTFHVSVSPSSPLNVNNNNYVQEERFEKKEEDGVSRIQTSYTDEDAIARDIRQFELKWESEMAEVDKFLTK